MKRSEGLSLVELLVSLVIISIVFVALASSQALGFKTTKQSVEMSTARDIATQQMEVIRSYGYFSYQNCPTTQPFLSIAPACQATDVSLAEHAGFSLSWSITNNPLSVAGQAINPSGGTPALVQVDVVVNSQDGSFGLTSYLSCADAGEFSMTTVPCPAGSLIQPVTTQTAGS